MNRQATRRRQTQFSIAISVALHIVVFFIFAGVKLYTEVDVMDEMPVAFVDGQRTTPLRRSFPVRPMISSGKSPQRRLRKRCVVSPRYRSPADFYVDSSVRVSSEIRSAILQDADLQSPVVRLRGCSPMPVSADLSDKPHLRRIGTQPRISQWRDFLAKMAPAWAGPDTNITDDALERFLSAVRRKIESCKRYPISARKAEIEGRVSVRIVILKDGRLEKAEVVESSGYRILDRAALRSVREAEPFPPIPDAVKLDRIDIGIRLVFKLSEGMQ